MRIQEMRELRDATPFRSFFIHLADGRAIPVRNRDFLISFPQRTNDDRLPTRRLIRHCGRDAGDEPAGETLQRMGVA